MKLKPSEVPIKEEGRLNLPFKFAIALAKGLYENGLPVHRIENMLGQLRKQLGIKGDFYANPNVLFVKLGSDTSARTIMVRTKQGETNLEKVALLDEIGKGVLSGEESLLSGLKKIEQLRESKGRYKTWMTVLFFGLSSASSARLFGGGLNEVLVACLIGTVVGLLLEISKYYENFGRIIITICSAFAISIAKLSTMVLGPVLVDLATITGLIMLLPGFSFTVSILEVVNEHPVSGTARFSKTIITFLMMAFGLSLGEKIDLFVNIVPADVTPYLLPEWTSYVPIIFVPIGFVVLFKAIPRHFFWILLSVFISYFGFKYYRDHFSAEVASFMASFSVGFAANLFSRMRNRPATIMLVPGVIMLVPGSVGFKAVSMLMQQQTLSGIEQAFSMLMIGMSLVMGLVVSTVILSPKKPL